MIFLIAFAAALCFSIVFSKLMRKHPLPFYAAAACISVIVVWCTWRHVSFPDGFETWVWPLFARGALAGALFVVIMFTGALPNGSKAIRLLMPVRGNLSIIACILTLGNNIAYGKTYFSALFLAPERLPLPTLLAAVCSLVMIVIMLPLFVTSFMCIRKRMKAVKWKRLQRFAYLFYALLYCHIMLLTVPNAIKGRPGYALTVFVYSLVFVSYLICRLMKAAAIREKTTESLQKKQMLGVLFGSVMAGLILTAVISAEKAAAAYDELETLRASLAAAAAAEPAPSPVRGTSDQEAETAVDAREDIRPSGKYIDGIYTGSADGNHGTGKDIEVSVVIENDVILSVEITGFRDDEEYYSPSIEGTAMIEAILQKQSPYVDVVTGATESSEGLIRAVSSALSKARNK